MSALPSPALVSEGERRRDRGALLAYRRHRLPALRAELVLLDALAAPGATATTDAIPDDLAAAYSDGGRWVGALVLRLLAARIIREVGTARSARPPRHRGRIGVYAVADPGAYQARRAALPALIETAGQSEARQLSLWPEA